MRIRTYLLLKVEKHIRHSKGCFFSFSLSTIYKYFHKKKFFFVERIEKHPIFVTSKLNKRKMANINYTIEKLSLKDAMWYGANQECYIVRYTSGFAPIHEFAALDSKGRYTDNPAKGYIHGNGNTGTGSILLTNISMLG